MMQTNSFGVSVEEFHRRNRARLRCWPRSLLATSTHDAKRGEDLRARINVLSEMPEDWRAALTRWSRINLRKKTRTGGGYSPDRNDEYLLYQTILGAWPKGALNPAEMDSFRKRIAAYMPKAAREAKVHTSWVNPNEAYEAALLKFARQLLDGGKKNRFLEDLHAFQHRLAFYGWVNSLAQVLLKITSPGIPDFYQGTELWDLSLVDPDNRRPVDYESRRVMLSEITQRMTGIEGRAEPIRDLIETTDDGRIKLYLTYRALSFRRSNQELFSSGSFTPLSVSGECAEHVCAFARSREKIAAVVVVPRLVARLTSGVERWPLGDAVWRNTRVALPAEAAGETFQNILTGEIVYTTEIKAVRVLDVSSVLRSFPVALLVRSREPEARSQNRRIEQRAAFQRSGTVYSGSWLPASHIPPLVGGMAGF